MPIDRSWIPAEDELADNTKEMARIRSVIDAGPFQDSWESLADYRVPRWYAESKFGIFIHWGIYSVPAFGSEWYARRMYQEGTPEFDHHRAHYGQQSDFGYKDFIPSFTMSEFDPEQWADLCYRAGAQYVVPVAEHHDGFCLYDEPRTRWKAPLMGPGRDVFGELTAALRRRYLTPGASSHRAEHWFYMHGGAQFDSDVRAGAYADFYGPAARQETGPNEEFCEDWLLRTVAIIDQYRPQLLWFDWWIRQPAFEPYRLMLAAYYYNRAAQWGRGVAIGYKPEAFRPGTAVPCVERGTQAQVHSTLWQNDTAVSRSSWGFVEDHDYKSVPQLLGELIDVVAKNGTVLLNIGPRADGTIAESEQRMLGDIGAWLDVNGEAVYGTRPWSQFGEGPTTVPAGSFVDAEPANMTCEDFRFTTRDLGGAVHLYATTTAWPDHGQLAIRALGQNSGTAGQTIHEVRVLGYPGDIEWQRTPQALVVRLPDHRPSAHGVCVRVELRPNPATPAIDYLYS